MTRKAALGALISIGEKSDRVLNTVLYLIDTNNIPVCVSCDSYISLLCFLQHANVGMGSYALISLGIVTEAVEETLLKALQNEKSEVLPYTCM